VRGLEAARPGQAAGGSAKSARHMREANTHRGTAAPTRVPWTRRGTTTPPSPSSSGVPGKGAPPTFYGRAFPRTFYLHRRAGARARAREGSAVQAIRGVPGAVLAAARMGKAARPYTRAPRPDKRVAPLFRWPLGVRNSTDQECLLARGGGARKRVAPGQAQNRARGVFARAVGGVRRGGARP